MSETSSPVLTPADADLLFRQARTTYVWADAPVTDADLHAAYDLAKFAPSAMNTQPLRIVALRSDEAKARLVPHMGDGNKVKVEIAPVTLILAYHPDFHEKMDVTFPISPETRDNLAAAPAVRLGMAKTNSLIQAGFLLVALRAVGLGVGPMTGLDFDGVTSEFFADTSSRPFLVVTVGHPEGSGNTHPRLPRLDYAEVVTEL
ncbi:MAG: malonic semialdehyde reductase [Cellulomonadaceae bacterium]|jgi:3-hydroxypropanoate dehydrogenase|nr:malonic semialdehyde reductase [Cellulomonadaceae bacterium]